MWQVLHLKASGERTGRFVLRHHQAFVVARVLIVRELLCSFFKTEFAGFDVGGDRVETRSQTLVFTLFNFRFEQNVAYIDFVALLFDELHDVEAKFRSHDFRHLFRIGERESYIGKFRYPLAATAQTEFTAVARATVLRIETCQNREARFAAVDATCKFAQAAFYAFHLFAIHRGALRDDLHFHLCGNHR